MCFLFFVIQVQCRYITFEKILTNILVNKQSKTVSGGRIPEPLLVF